MALMSLAAHRCSILLLATALGFVPAVTLSQCPHSGSSRPAVTWPGFATALQNGRYIVVFVDAARRAQLPPTGARLVGCDGESAEQLARQRLEGSAPANAARLLWNTDGSLAPPLPSACTFETAAGQTAYRMQYAPASAAVISAAIAAAAGESRPLPYPRLF
ncbi:MAG TPA: hypothetical protein VKB72_14200 [Steroidobacteraceae bacterium]|nr:hypothetical protein [Steroidobacteraceae bacterium]